jgi:hypothetical protein
MARQCVVVEQLGAGGPCEQLGAGGPCEATSCTDDAQPAAVDAWQMVSSVFLVPMAPAHARGC